MFYLVAVREKIWVESWERGYNGGTDKYVHTHTHMYTHTRTNTCTGVLSLPANGLFIFTQPETYDKMDCKGIETVSSSK